MIKLFVPGIISSIGIIGLVIGYGLGALVNKNYVTFEGDVIIKHHYIVIIVNMYLCQCQKPDDVYKLIAFY